MEEKLQKVGHLFLKILKGIDGIYIVLNSGKSNFKSNKKPKEEEKTFESVIEECNEKSERIRKLVESEEVVSHPSMLRRQLKKYQLAGLNW